MIVADRAALAAKGLEGEAHLRDWTAVGVPPRIMGAGPVPAIAKLLKRNELTVSDIDYFEINEAFAVVNLHAERQLGIPRDRTNLYGGGISIGHPPGATGGRGRSPPCTISPIRAGATGSSPCASAVARGWRC